MPDRQNQRWCVIATLVAWNMAAGFGFYAYILDCYVNYPPDHEKRKFKYHTFHGNINQDVVIGLFAVMVCQIISTVLLCLAFNMARTKCFLYGLFLSMPFACACLPAWPVAVTHVTLVLVALSYYWN